MRATKIGVTSVVCPDAKLIHYGGQSDRIRADKMLRLFRAKGQLIERHWPRYQVPFGFAMLRCWAWTRMVATRVKNGFTSSEANRTNVWREIWARRGENSKPVK
jgi:N-acetylglucosaminyl-diphospho-decaprenol L-rhamnosyltransferase